MGGGNRASIPLMVILLGSGLHGNIIGCLCIADKQDNVSVACCRLGSTARSAEAGVGSVVALLSTEPTISATSPTL